MSCCACSTAATPPTPADRSSAAAAAPFSAPQLALELLAQHHAVGRRRARDGELVSAAGAQLVAALARVACTVLAVTSRSSQPKPSRNTAVPSALSPDSPSVTSSSDRSSNADSALASSARGSATPSASGQPQRPAIRHSSASIRSSRVPVEVAARVREPARASKRAVAPGHGRSASTKRAPMTASRTGVHAVQRVASSHGSSTSSGPSTSRRAVSRTSSPSSTTNAMVPVPRWAAAGGSQRPAGTASTGRMARWPISVAARAPTARASAGSACSSVAAASVSPGGALMGRG